MGGQQGTGGGKDGGMDGGKGKSGGVDKPEGSREPPAPDPEPELPSSDDPLEKRREKQVEVANKVEQKKRQREQEKQQRENDTNKIKEDIKANRKEAKELEALGKHKLIEKAVEVPVYVEKAVKKEVIEYVDIIRYVDKVVKKRWEVPVVKDKWVEVPVEKIVYKEKKVEVEKIVEIEVDEIVDHKECIVQGWNGSFDEWTDQVYKSRTVHRHEERIPIVQEPNRDIEEKQLHYTEVSPDRIRLRNQFTSMSLTGLTGMNRMVNRITDEHLAIGGLVDRRYQTIQGISPDAHHPGYIHRYSRM